MKPAACCRAAALLALVGPALAAATYSVRDYGAVGNGSANDTASIQAAVDAAAKAGGGEVLLPPGTYRSSALFLRSHVEFNVAAGAVLEASPLPADWSGCNLAGVINGRGLEGVALEGGGTIDGGGAAFYDARGNFRPGDRPQTIVTLRNCSHVLIRGLTFRHSTRWTIVLSEVEHATVERIMIRNPEFGLARESDGVDLNNCRHALVQDCDIETGDDGICIKPQGRSRSPGEYDILVQRCTVATTCNAVKIGTGTSSDLHDMVIRDITVNRHSDIRSNGNPIKTDRWGSQNGSCIAAIAVESNDGDEVRNVAYENFTIDDCDTPIFVEIENRQTYAPHPSIGTIRDITFRNIRCLSSARASQINCQVPGRFHHLVFENIDIHNRETCSGNANPPRLTGAYPDAQRLGRMPAYGLFARDVDGLVFKGQIAFHDDGRTGRPAFVSDDSTIAGR